MVSLFKNKNKILKLEKSYNRWITYLTTIFYSKIINKLARAIIKYTYLTFDKNAKEQNVFLHNHQRG